VRRKVGIFMIMQLDVKRERRQWPRGTSLGRDDS
jgi:hypothetical protein